MVNKLLYEFLVVIITCLILVNSVNQVTAITGSIGNARMLLKAEVGDTIDKYVLVKNVNNVTLNISVYATEELSEDIVIKNKEFLLLPGEEKKAEFTVKIKKEGITETKINVRFTPIDGKNGVGLSSTLIINAKKGSGSWFDFSDNDNEDENIEDNNIKNDNIILDDYNPDIANNDNNNKNKYLIAIVMTIIIFIIFIVLVIISSKLKKEGDLNENKSKKKSSNK
jgi:hypothetical protein